MKTLIFGGTTEGRRLAELLAAEGVNVTLSVATEYGRGVAESAGVEVISERLGAERMSELMRLNRFDCVVDATHPYAENVTKNIKQACAETGAEYLRLRRGKSVGGQSAAYVGTAAEAAELLKGTRGGVLLAIGVKELEYFTGLEGYSDRLFVRIIPMPDSLQRALSLGFRNTNIICMQGPFDTDMNIATLRMTGAKYMVTKDSGDIGGFSQKLAAAERVGCGVIVISRPEEDGVDFDGVLKRFGVSAEGRERKHPFTFFPLFTDMRGRKITVVGGGAVAERRINKLLPFGADITVVSPEVTSGISGLARQGIIRHISRVYRNGDLAGAFLAIAAADDRGANRAVKAEAEERGVLAIVSDNRDECDCYFPAIAENDGFIAGIVSKTGEHSGVAALAENFRRLLTNEQDS